MEIDQFQLTVREVLETILKNETVRELCVYNPEILEQITQKIIDFIALQMERIKQNKKKHPRTKKNSLGQSALKDPLDELEKTYQQQLKMEERQFRDEIFQQAEQMKEIQNSLRKPMKELSRMFDLGEGHWQRVDFNILSKYLRLLERNKVIQQFADMLGKMNQTSKKYEAGRADLTGVHESADISDILPSEAALLSDNTTELLFYKKFSEKKLQTYEFAEKKQDDIKGPIIICVDTSGSMEGAPENFAKMFCLALLKRASKGGRKCFLISFSSGIKSIELTDIKRSLNKVIDFLAMSFHGGTDAMMAMKKSLEMLETKNYKKADVVMISDFEMDDLHGNMKEQIQKARQNKTKFHSIAIGNNGNKSLIEKFDHKWQYNPHNKKDMLTLLKNIGKL
jgi:uncharacterized protein with von Willebrand factor type A (vWA) domain